MAKKYMHMVKHPNEMTADELRDVLGGVNNAKVVRSLLIAERDTIRAGVEREQRTLRNLWYTLVKPALSRLGTLNKLTSKGNKVNWPKLLSDHLAELVRGGNTSYGEMKILDASRVRRPALAVVRTLVDVRLVGAHYPWVILFTEKDTIWSEVRRLASLYGVSAISGSGQPSNACTWDVVQKIRGQKAYRGQDIVLLSLTDYDPSGYSIANSQMVQLQENAIGCNVIHTRLGLEPEQLTTRELETNAYTPAGKGFDKWYRETGGVNGQPLGLELDALPLSRLREMFADGIAQVVDLTQRREDLRYAFLDLVACELLLPDFTARREYLKAAIMRGGVWDKVCKTELTDDLFKQAARAGWDSIDPVATSVGDRPLFDQVSDVREAMRDALGAYTTT